MSQATDVVQVKLTRSSHAKMKTPGIKVKPKPKEAPYLSTMRRFIESRKPKCSVLQGLHNNNTDYPTKEFCNGAVYTGEWNLFGMSGLGTFEFASKGVVYTGEMDDGLFDGDGEIHFNKLGTVGGLFKKGALTDDTRKLIFTDGLEYKMGDAPWKYCRDDDRRYSLEYEFDLQPAGLSFSSAIEPPVELPPGCYDCGIGIFDPKLEVIFAYGCYRHRIVSSPSVEEQDWIKRNCRRNPSNPVGPKQAFYAHWNQPTLKLPFPARSAAEMNNFYNETLKSFSASDFEQFEDPSWRSRSSVRRTSSASTGRFRNLLFYKPPELLSFINITRL